MNKQETAAACRHIHLSTTQLRLQPSQGDTDWGDYWLPFRLTQSGHKLAILPAIVCTETTLFHHKGHWGAQLSQRSPTTTGVTAVSLFILSVSSSSPLRPQASFSSAFLMLLFQSSAISLSIPVWIPSFWARTLFFSNPFCPAKHLTFVWQCFCVGVSPCYLCVPCISVGVLSCMSLSCTDRCLYSSSPQRSGGTPAQKFGSKRSRLTIFHVFFLKSVKILRID